MEIMEIGSRREVLWDEALMERADGISVRMHKPEYRGIALDLDRPWEGNVCGYFSIIEDEGMYRLYYRGMDWTVAEDSTVRPHHPTYFCYAESRDGMTFERVPLGIHSFWGRSDNNIIVEGVNDNLFFFRDTNPACPPEERYKGLGAESRKQALALFTSSDGVHFEKKRIVADDGAYDSLNTAFYHEPTGRYYLFYRGLHGEAVENGKWGGKMARGNERHNIGVIRDVRVRTSADFVEWSKPRRIAFDPERDDLELYTNQVQPYFRAKHMMIGFPTRYIDRFVDPDNFRHLPDRKHRDVIIRLVGREGTAMTDAAVMTSRDGLTFRRTEEAFLTPGPERGRNWYYGDCYLAYGMTKTKSPIPGAPDEISMFMGVNYNQDHVRLARFAIRTDGFFSWRADYEPGKVVTKPFTFEGNTLEINFATSAFGYVRISLADENGAVIPGYESGRLFGDSIDRCVDFEKPLGALAGRPVRMVVEMSDADFYSFRFFETPEVL